MKRVRVVVHGRVQGVFFRASTRDVARALGLGGWVRNRPDGMVELVAEGEEEAVDRLVGWCREGPPLAAVERLDVVEEPPTGAEGPFHVRH